MQTFIAGQDNTMYYDVVGKADGEPITSGTVTFYLIAKNGDYEGYWWDATNGEWSDTLASAGAGTHVDSGNWKCEIDSDAWDADVQYLVYAKESGDLNILYREEVISIDDIGVQTTEQAENVIDVCNFALAILNGAINASYPFLDSWDEDATSQEALATLRWMKVCYPRARNRMQSLWDWPACLRFAAMGAELSSASAHTVPGWEYVYSKPEGCLAFRGIVAADVHETTGKLTEYPFIEIGSQIACNVHNDDDDDPDYLFKYNVLVQNPGDWGEDLYQATAFLLAYYASRAMGATLENQAVVKQLYEDAFATARSGCQGSTFELRPDVQTGGSVELGPGNIDWKFPLPE